MAAMALTREKIMEDIDALSDPPSECPECRRLRDALAEQNRALRETDKHRMEFRWMDMTPDDGLPERILSGYLDYSEWTDNALGMEPSNPLIVQMNRDRAKRNAIIEQALAALSPQPPTASPSAPAECPECGGSGRVSLLADDDGGMTTRPCACQSLPAPEAVSGDSELERLRRIEKAVDRAIGACIFRDDPDRDELACDECQWREVCAALAKEGSDATA